MVPIHANDLYLYVVIQAFIGDRYGYRPFPAEIPNQEFEIFLNVGSKCDVDTSFLTKWYKCDRNSVDIVYQLQPITNHFPDYIVKDIELRSQAQKEWWQEFQAIQKTIWTLVKMAVENRVMTKKRAHFYLQSGL